jgi:hypothetical protein
MLWYPTCWGDVVKPINIRNIRRSREISGKIYNTSLHESEHIQLKFRHFMYRYYSIFKINFKDLQFIFVCSSSVRASNASWFKGQVRREGYKMRSFTFPLDVNSGSEFVTAQDVVWFPAVAWDWPLVPSPDDPLFSIRNFSDGIAAVGWSWVLTPSRAEFNNQCRYTSIPPYAFMACRGTTYNVSKSHSINQFSTSAVTK